jgi:hypothetical protein
MPLWGNLDQANNAPKFKGVLAGTVNYDRNYNHAGPASKVVFPSGAGYNNTDILVVNAGTSTTYSNAAYALSTNATGYIQSVGKITPGSFSSNTVAGVLSFSITNSSYGTASGNTTVTGFTATVDQRVSGAELYGNATPGAFINGVAFGVFGVSANEVSNTTYSRKIQQGWVLRKVGEGPVTSATATAGVSFANGETVALSNGSVKGVLTLVTNATSNLVSATITSGGLFDVNTNVVVAFNREKHVANSGVAINYTGTATGYNNTDVVTVANGITNATASVSTNATGGSLTFTITNVGLFSNTAANNSVVITIANSTGGASLGTGATFTTANLVTSTGGSVTVNTLGGRAGRIQHETLAFVHMASENNADTFAYPNIR